MRSFLNATYDMNLSAVDFYKQGQSSEAIGYKRGVDCSKCLILLVPGAGLEPAQPKGRGILNPYTPLLIVFM